MTSMQIALVHRLNTQRSIERLHMHIEELRAMKAPTDGMEEILRDQEAALIKVELHIANLDEIEQRRRG
jgi:hypothetical protein